MDLKRVGAFLKGSEKFKFLSGLKLKKAFGLSVILFSTKVLTNVTLAKLLHWCETTVGLRSNLDGQVPRVPV